MNMLLDFWTYCQCYEVSRNYALWSGLGLLSATANRKIFVSQGDIRHYATTYICLVGEQGIKKSTSKNFARDLFTSAFPNAAIGAAMQTREEIIKFLSSEDSTRAFRDADGTLVEYHPYAFFINELKNFLSFNPAGMIEFLTDIYDAPVFDARTLKRGQELIVNPALTILACETPAWIIDKLKMNIISGGFSRRMIYVYEVGTQMACCPRPVITSEARDAYRRIKVHLLKVANLAGEFKWEADAEKWFDDWYRDNRKRLPDESVFRGYRLTKDVLLLKVAMLVAASKPEPKLLITVSLLEESLAVLDAIEPDMPKLFVASGRNMLAPQQVKMMGLVEQNGGIMIEKELLAKMSNDLAPFECMSMIRFLKDTDQLFTGAVRVGEVQKQVVMTKERYQREQARQGHDKPK